MNKSNHHYGPTLPLSEELDTIKYRQTGESFYDKCVRIADALKDSQQHFKDFKDALRHMRFIPCLLYTSPSPRDLSTSRMPSSA